MEIQDLSTSTYHRRDHAKLRYVSVGWLGASVPSRGGLDPQLLDKLRIAHDECQLLCGLLGMHPCGICAAGSALVPPGRNPISIPASHGEFFLEFEATRYVFPNMVFHYVEAHNYRPPEEVLRAIHCWDAKRWQQSIVSISVDRTIRELGGRLVRCSGRTLYVDLVHGAPEAFLELARSFLPAEPYEIVLSSNSP